MEKMLDRWSPTVNLFPASPSDDRCREIGPILVHGAFAYACRRRRRMVLDRAHLYSFVTVINRRGRVRVSLRIRGDVTKFCTSFVTLMGTTVLVK